MSFIKSAADTVYIYRFIRLLILDWKKWDAYKLGIIDKNGKRIKSQKLDTTQRKAAYTPFIRLVANTKRIFSRVPGINTKLGSFAAALYLIKEYNKLEDKHLVKILDAVNIKTDSLISENSNWFDKKLKEGYYSINNDKIVNTTFENLVYQNDSIYIQNGNPVGNIFGVNIYEATHKKTKQKIYITSSEIF